MLFILKRTSRLKYKVCYRHCRVSILKEFPFFSAAVHAKRARTNGTHNLMDAQTSLLKCSNPPQQHRPRSENRRFCCETLSYAESNNNAEDRIKKQHNNESQAIAVLHSTTSLPVKHDKVLPTQIRYIHQHCANRSSSIARADAENTSAEARSSKATLKSLKDIPGPFSLPWLGTSWMYWTLGPYNRHTFHQADEGEMVLRVMNFNLWQRWMMTECILQRCV